MRPADTKPATYIAFDFSYNIRNLKYKVSDDLPMPQYNIKSSKINKSNMSQKVFVIKKVKDQAPWAYVIEYLNSDETT